MLIFKKTEKKYRLPAVANWSNICMTELTTALLIGGIRLKSASFSATFLSVWQ